MFLCWRYGGDDPWRLYNRLDDRYRRLWDPLLPAVRPRFPDRLQNWMYACGQLAAIMEGKMKEERPPVTQRSVPSRITLPPGVEDPRAEHAGGA